MVARVKIIWVESMQVASDNESRGNGHGHRIGRRFRNPVVLGEIYFVLTVH
jgi:hypothetical protein